MELLLTMMSGLELLQYDIVGTSCSSHPTGSITYIIIVDNPLLDPSSGGNVSSIALSAASPLEPEALTMRSGALVALLSSTSVGSTVPYAARVASPSLPDVMAAAPVPWHRISRGHVFHSPVPWSSNLYISKATVSEDRLTTQRVVVVKTTKKKKAVTQIAPTPPSTANGYSGEQDAHGFALPNAAEVAARARIEEEEERSRAVLAEDIARVRAMERAAALVDENARAARALIEAAANKVQLEERAREATLARVAAAAAAKEARLTAESEAVERQAKMAAAQRAEAAVKAAAEEKIKAALLLEEKFAADSEAVAATARQAKQRADETLAAQLAEQEQQEAHRLLVLAEEYPLAHDRHQPAARLQQ